MMKQGDFSNLAKEYKNRTGYSFEILKMIHAYVEKQIKITKIADIGAGTGKLTEQLLELGFNGFAVEPNNEMRMEGIRQNEYGNKILWSKGSGEKTELEDNSVDWVFMASSFHWQIIKSLFLNFIESLNLEVTLQPYGILEIYLQ